MSSTTKEADDDPLRLLDRVEMESALETVRSSPLGVRRTPCLQVAGVECRLNNVNCVFLLDKNMQVCESYIKLCTFPIVVTCCCLTRCLIPWNCT